MPSPLDRNYNLLLADPDRALCETIASALAGHGHKVTVGHDGETVMGLLRDGQFDLAIVALDLPEIDGFSVLSNCRENYALAGMPVVVLAVTLADEVCERAFALGASAYVVRPVSTPLLTHTVWQLLRGRARDLELKWLKTRLGIQSDRQLELAY